MVIQESGGVLDAIKHLDMYKENIFDKLTVLEIYGKLVYYCFIFYYINYKQFKLYNFWNFIFEFIT